MKKIINGKLYDTETATEVDMIDIHDEYESYHIYETLYKKRNGEYFLQRDMIGDGDAIDEFNWVLDHRFEPLTTEQAKQWMEQYSSVDDYAEQFGMPEE